MPRECLSMPELHETVMSLISSVREKQTSGGTIPMKDLVKLINLDLSQADLESIKSRGDITLEPTDERGGSFSNTGDELKVKSGGITYMVPKIVRGTYSSSANQTTFSYDTENTISGKFLFFNAHLEELRIDDVRVDIDISGEAFDQCIIHGDLRKAA